MFMRTFFELFMGGHTSVAQPAVVNPYVELNRVHQGAVREYFAATLEVRRLFDSIRLRNRAVDHEKILERFDRAEKNYAGIGFMPVLPTCVSLTGPNGISEFDADRLFACGIFARRNHAGMPVMFAPGVGRHLVRLINSSAVKTLHSEFGHSIGNGTVTQFPPRA